ncbi:MAG: rod shape-determining protein MreD [Coxiellaceae bacterium]|nr:MAG: rod shape-determining protein MreD [Coxiellaceae bacterium]
MVELVSSSLGDNDNYFWAYALPYRFGIFVPWMLGLLVDIIYGTYLGEHALAFSLIAYITIKLQQRMQIFSDWQRWFTVMALLAFYQLIIFITQSVFGHTPMTWYYWASPITSAILWPAWSGLLSLCQRRFRVVDQLPMRRFTYGREL